MTLPTPFSAPPVNSETEAELVRALANMAIVSADQPVALTALTGGVSSDIFRADLPTGPVCVKWRWGN